MAIKLRAWTIKTAAAAVLALACAQAAVQAAAQETTSPSPAPSPPSAPAVLPPQAAADSVRLKQAIDAAQSGDVSAARNLSTSLSSPAARKLVTWAMVDSAGSSLNFFELDSAKRDLWGWPRAARRQTAAERAIEAANLSPQRVVDWFEGKEPDTPEGAMALAGAYQQLNRQADAQALIRHVFRDKAFEADPQARMIARFGSYLSAEDYAKRLDMLLYGTQGPAARALMDLVGADVRSLADARIALRANRDDASATVDRVAPALQADPALAFERARYYRRRNLDGAAAALIRSFPAPPAGQPGAVNLVWTERRALLMTLTHAGDFQTAYAAATNHGLPYGEDYTEAEFFAGWIALRKLNNPAAAADHFANIAKAGSSPITLSRALYWQGRAAEASGDQASAQRFWSEGAKYYTAFYGQLSADRAGVASLALPPDPVPTAEDRARFEGRDQVRAARMLADAGERDLFRSFVLALDDVVPNAEELALLVDMARLYGDQDLSMRVVRAGAVRGFYLPERGYPVRNVPAMYGAPEPALVHAIIRQESGFDPIVRSGPGARGMMQLMPTTAANVARKLGVSYSADRLNDPDYNMRLGSAYLGDLVNTFSGSYVMAAAAYNAGPGRPSQWAAECGDPRGGATDPSDFIECIPFSETRNYVMRIMEATQVYRARMNGGQTPMTAAADLKRGGYGVVGPNPYQVASLSPTPTLTPGVDAGAGPTPYADLGARAAAEARADVPAIRTVRAERDEPERCTPTKVKTGKGRHAKTKTVCVVAHGKAAKGKAAKAGRGGKHAKAHATSGGKHKAAAKGGLRRRKH